MRCIWKNKIYTSTSTNIPLGTSVHNIEFQPGQGGQIARAAGTVAQVIAKAGNFAIFSSFIKHGTKHMIYDESIKYGISFNLARHVDY